MKLIKYFSVITLVLAFSACDDFGDVNVDPNNPSNVSTDALLTAALRNIPGIISQTQPGEYVQLYSQKQYTASSNYQDINFSYDGLYAGPLTDLQEIIRLNSDPELAGAQLKNGSLENQIAVAQTAQSYFFLFITDSWGNIPYSQALKGRENFRPAFDDQQAVYNGLFNTLTEASSALASSSGTITGDILLDGDLNSWRLFANSLRMVMALRISDVDANKGKAEFNAALSAGVISSNDENIVYKHLTDEDNDNLWEDRFETRRDWAVAKPLVDYLNETDDPRVTVYADPALSKSAYVGMPYGLTEAEAGSIPNNDVSFFGNSLRQKDSPTYVVTYSQILFSLAEAAHLGWISGGAAAAEQYYKDAIKASWEQWGVFDQAKFDTFILKDAVKWVSGEEIKRIHQQKWVSLFTNGPEAWAEWRRSDYPVLTPSPNPINPVSTGIPVRYGYPITEPTLNGDNYNAVLEKIGRDNIDVRVWWDVK
ncbi:MAG: SusD/RagB family nutrient-binding outer membrane lipoprotein [Saprospiraceae bacterium]|nr:SusD/RagB family nutrient-binding outer membrane lipoprotein [Saprospiraceae bacterium]